MGHNYPIRVLIWVIHDQSKAWFPHRSACHVCFQNYPLVLKHGNWKLYVHQILIWKRFISLFIHASHTSKTYISIHVILDNIHMSTSIHMYIIYIYAYIYIYTYKLINGCTTIYYMHIVDVGEIPNHLWCFPNVYQVTCLHLEKVVTVPRDEPSNINGSIRSALGIGFLEGFPWKSGGDLWLGRLIPSGYVMYGYVNSLRTWTWPSRNSGFTHW